MATKVRHLFEPLPTEPLKGVLGFKFETAPSPTGPWAAHEGGTLVHEPSTVDCETLAIGANGVSNHPGVDFTKGDCFEWTAVVPDTATHLRASACDVVSVTEVNCSAPGNVVFLPETNPGALFFLFVLIALAVGLDNPRQQPGGTLGCPKRRGHTL